MAVSSTKSHDHPVEISIIHYFRKLKDPRRRERCRHQLLDIVVIALCATIAGAQDWQEIVTFGEKRFDWLKRFLKLPNGIPSHDTFERVFDRINPRAFQACFRNWVEAIREVLPIKHIAIDGKTLRSSGTDKLKTLHLVSAWATEQHLSLGQVAVDDNPTKSRPFPSCWTCWTLKALS